MELPSTHGSCPALLLESSNSNKNTTTTTIVEIHPLVLLSVLDHHTRRPEGAGRVIGTLLGRKPEPGSNRVEITNCFAVPHAERGDEVAIGKDFNRQMMALHLRANRRERVVGWYATALPSDEENGSGGGEKEKKEESGSDKGTTTAVSNRTKSDSQKVEYKCVADTSSLIHEFYASECEDDPVHVVLDTSLSISGDSVALKAYKSTPVIIKKEPLANLFHEIQLFIKATHTEKICLDHMIRQQGQGEIGDDDTAPLAVVPSSVPPSPTTPATLQHSVAQLYQMLETAAAYVDGVVDGDFRVDDHDQMGHQIADTLAAIPKIRPDVFDKMFNDTLQDLLMVTYLTNLTRTQLTIAEKLNAALHV